MRRSWIEEYTSTEDSLRAFLIMANNCYRNGEPIISDEEYDELEAMYKDDFGGTMSICDDHGYNAEVEHGVRMLSQQKTYSLADVRKLMDDAHDTQYDMSIKMDGFAVSLRYEFGSLRMASTRGDGSVGLDITDAVVRGCHNIPIVLPGAWKDKAVVEVRGEMLIPKRFAQGNKSARSICVGAFKRKDVAGIEEYDPHFFGYDVVEPEGKTMQFRREAMEYMGFQNTPFKAISGAPTLDYMNEQIGKLIEKVEKLGFEYDGVVFRCNDQLIYRNMGYTEHHPKGAIAFKFKGEMVDTYVMDITYTHGETGKITPVAEIKPVTCGGCVIRSVSLGSIEVMNARGIKVGSHVRVTRKGGVIPQIEEVLK